MFRTVQGTFPSRTGFWIGDYGGHHEAHCPQGFRAEYEPHSSRVALSAHLISASTGDLIPAEFLSFKSRSEEGHHSPGTHGSNKPLHMEMATLIASGFSTSLPFCCHTSFPSCLTLSFLSSASFYSDIWTCSFRSHKIMISCRAMQNRTLSLHIHLMSGDEITPRYLW